jgi:hypothetical protein
MEFIPQAFYSDNPKKNWKRRMRAYYNNIK